MFVLAGLGQNKEEIPIGVLDNLKKADYIFLEGYTNYIPEDVIKFLRGIREDIQVVDRGFVEGELEKFILKNKEKTIMLLVSGNPLFATTHMYFIKLCKEHKIKFKVIGASSIFDEIGRTGLFLYKFGKIISIPFHKSKSFFDDLVCNYKNGMHTLVLLDLDPLHDKYLDLKEALQRVLMIAQERNEKIFNEDTKIVVCSNLGRENEKIFYISIKDAMRLNLEPPICIIFPGRLNRIELEMLRCMTNY